MVQAVKVQGVEAAKVAAAMVALDLGGALKVQATVAVGKEMATMKVVEGASPMPRQGRRDWCLRHTPFLRRADTAHTACRHACSSQKPGRRSSVC